MSQYNNIKITPNIGVTSDPIIEFTGAANSTITLKVLDTADAGLTFVGEKAEILSLIDTDPSPTSQIPRFSVNDYYGLPQIQAYNDGRVVLTFVDAQNVGVGTINPTEKLDVVGNIKLTGAIYGPSTLIIDPSAVGDDTGTVEIKGDLIVQGTTTTINSTIVDLDHLSLGDNETANFGDGNDLRIYHDGTNSYIDNSTGSLFLTNTSIDVSGYLKFTNPSAKYIDFYTKDINNNVFGSILRLVNHDGTDIQNAIQMVRDSGVTLFYNNTEKLQTILDGVSITGSLGINEPNPQSALSVNGYIQESTDGGTVYYNVVTQQDVGTAPNQVPLNQFLGEMAYANYPFAQVLDNTSGSDSIVSVNASAVDLYSHIASLTTNVTYQISNLTTGNEIKMYIRNTDASARTITIQASETVSGYANVNLAPGSSTPGGSSVSSVTLNATNGTTLIWISNISGNIVGGILA